MQPGSLGWPAEARSRTVNASSTSTRHECQQRKFANQIFAINKEALGEAESEGERECAKERCNFQEAGSSHDVQQCGILIIFRFQFFTPLWASWVRAEGLSLDILFRAKLLQCHLLAARFARTYIQTHIYLCACNDDAGVTT